MKENMQMEKEMEKERNIMIKVQLSMKENM